jgi:Taurine catabolism dioxygenase TauD, TfdA family
MNAPVARNLFERFASPFDLDDDPSYQRWRAWKLAEHPKRIEELMVDVADPRCLTDAEGAALRDRIARANVAVYRSRVFDEDPQIALALGAQLGLRRLDANWLADEDGISRVAVSAKSDGRGGFIPYTNRPLGWHTDGYYHGEERRIHAMILHCVRPAQRGGVNALLDHEMAYIGLRDASKHHVRALMQPDAMSIPSRSDAGGLARDAQSGPVISLDAPDGGLHLRYTARQRSIEWKADAATCAARLCLEGLLAGSAAWIFRVHLQAGMGIVGHNILHARAGFDDEPQRPRLLYRARYLDRVDLPKPAAWRNG